MRESSENQKRESLKNQKKVFYSYLRDEFGLKPYIQLPVHYIAYCGQMKDVIRVLQMAKNRLKPETFQSLLKDTRHTDKVTGTVYAHFYYNAVRNINIWKVDNIIKVLNLFKYEDDNTLQNKENVILAYIYLTLSRNDVSLLEECINKFKTAFPITTIHALKFGCFDDKMRLSAYALQKGASLAIAYFKFTPLALAEYLNTRASRKDAIETWVSLMREGLLLLDNLTAILKDLKGEILKIIPQVINLIYPLIDSPEEKEEKQPEKRTTLKDYCNVLISTYNNLDRSTFLGNSDTSNEQKFQLIAAQFLYSEDKDSKCLNEVTDNLSLKKRIHQPLNSSGLLLLNELIRKNKHRTVYSLVSPDSAVRVANPDEKDVTKRSALHWAVEKSDDSVEWLKTIQLLLHQMTTQADPDKEGETAVHIAARTQKPKTLKLLLQHFRCRESILIKNNKGETPLHIAAVTKTDDSGTIIRLLAEQPDTQCNLEERNWNGNTAFLVACTENNTSAVFELMSLGCDQDTCGRHGQRVYKNLINSNHSSYNEAFVNKLEELRNNSASRNSKFTSFAPSAPSFPLNQPRQNHEEGEEGLTLEQKGETKEEQNHGHEADEMAKRLALFKCKVTRLLQIRQAQTCTVIVGVESISGVHNPAFKKELGGIIDTIWECTSIEAIKDYLSEESQKTAISKCRKLSQWNAFLVKKQSTTWKSLEKLFVNFPSASSQNTSEPGSFGI
ncbi:ankyrin repeat protein [Coxiella burnetii CbuG_Q212]|nr:ankyrin repeat protein [Coxiella burnetii CbuG_Q212]